MSQNLLSVAVVIGALRVNSFAYWVILHALLSSADFFKSNFLQKIFQEHLGAQWPSGRVLESRQRGLLVRASPALLRCVLEQDTLMVQPRKTHPDITENLLTGT